MVKIVPLSLEVDDGMVIRSTSRLARQSSLPLERAVGRVSNGIIGSVASEIPMTKKGERVSL